mmetsp:Transcript_55056/g.112517  ORF Transcript_55056/g.112517 Transcript_55056/m.112517 type:complete len:120 (-) Transcript_55056:136-495(-)|eukprot:CAMPEP_0181316074 /NCGR_PEP_ID=MMETSP1101-20121128/15703_1 /TAXON_ID=46948 /ORGANISM="Rhodomonas abbreviata, Strain Caron Lab Isolate" /LENGTH=119 /DNA_ID=CAMNT_0023423301 /DNA_START=130 /DNA_END=489 /DNA_ORIENTATION=+
MPFANAMRSAAVAVQGRKQSPAPVAAQRQIVVPAAKEEIQISALDAQLITYLGKDSPAIPMGVFATGVILLSGLVSFNNANAKMQQNFMRARIVSQGITVAIMMGSLAVQERAKVLGLQ